jgi:hypothetical protein
VFGCPQPAAPALNAGDQLCRVKLDRDRRRFRGIVRLPGLVCLLVALSELALGFPQRRPASSRRAQLLRQLIPARISETLILLANDPISLRQDLARDVHIVRSCPE